MLHTTVEESPSIIMMMVRNGIDNDQRLLYGDHGHSHYVVTQTDYLHNGVEDDDYVGDGIPLNDVTRSITIVVHYMAIPAVTIAMWCVLTNYEIFQQRIHSPFLLIVALSWMLMGTTFEISNHYYIDNWQLYDPQADLINGSFSFFNFGSQNLLAFSLRKKNYGGNILFRPKLEQGADVHTTTNQTKKVSCLDYMVSFWDPIFLLLIVINPIVYGVVGRSTSVTALSPLASIAGLFILFRTWYNCGPNTYTKYGGIFFFVLVICGVIMLSVYRNTNTEWVHILIGGSFVSSTIPLSIAFYNITPEEEKNEHANDNNDDVGANEVEEEAVQEGTDGHQKLKKEKEEA